jgi:hypothetical protein
MRLRGALCACLVLAPCLPLAAARNPSDYPLRVHIFGRSETKFYAWRDLEESKGEGRANLFENGTPHAVDFNFSCSDNLHSSFGYTTYPARWKKPGKELEVLLPVFGKTGSYWTCDFHTDVKDFAYFSHQGHLGSEPIDRFKAWMVKHNYDPEHGLESPTRPGTEPGAGAPNPSSAPPAAPQ